MAYFYRAERLSVLKKYTKQLHPNLDYFKRGNWYDPDTAENYYKGLESQLYATSKLDDLDDKMDEIEKALFDVLERTKNSPFLRQGAFRAEISGSSFAPFLRAVLGLSHQFNLNRARTSRKRPVLKILLSFPVIREIWGYDRKKGAYLQDEIISNVILSLLNPVKFVHDFLSFLDASIDRFLEIGLTRGNPTPIPQAFLKGVVGFVIGVIKTPVAILRPLGDVLPWLVNSLLIQPVKYNITNKGLKALEKESGPDLSAYEQCNDCDFYGPTGHKSTRFTQSSSLKPFRQDSRSSSAQWNADTKHSLHFFSDDIDEETGAHLEEKEDSGNDRFRPGSGGEES